MSWRRSWQLALLLLLLLVCPRSVAYANEIKPPEGYELVLGETIAEPPLILTYDETREMFRYAMPNGVCFWVTAPSGAMTKSFALELEGNTMVKLHHNNLPVPYESGGVLTAPGIYRFSLHQLPQNNDLNGYTVTVWVRVQGEYENQMDILTPPYGFSISHLMRDGEMVELIGDRGSWLEQDGVYEAEMESSDGTLVYTSTFALDRTAPYIFFSGDARCGYSDKAVAFVSSEPEESTIAVLRDGILYQRQGVLGDSGRYVLTVTDRAGNSRSYRIQVRLSDCNLSPDPSLLILSVIGILCIAVVMLRARFQSRLI